MADINVLLLNEIINILLDKYFNTVFEWLVGGVAQWYNVGLWPANFPCPALDLQLMGDH